MLHLFRSFFYFRENVKIDNRTAPQGIIINFSVQGTELANSVVNSMGQYEQVFIQGFSDFYSEQIDITINGNESEQKIYYVSPQKSFF